MDKKLQSDVLDLWKNSLMYVYSDAVCQQEVGGTLVQLLETVPINPTLARGIQTNYVVNPPRYQRVGKYNLDSIQVQINTDTGDLWPFDTDREKVIARLSFRRKPFYQ